MVSIRRLACLSLLPALLAAAEEPAPGAPAPKKDIFEEVQTHKDHYDQAARDLIEEANSLKGQVLLVWVVDQSNSMKDDQEAVRARVQRLYDGIDRKKVKLTMAVVAFAEKPVEIQAPTREAEKVMAALAALVPDESGRENCMGAVRFALQRYGRMPEKKLVVLVTDERGDDEKEVEEALAALQKGGARFHCIGREAPFCACVAREDTGNPKQPLAVVSSGPETPEMEALPASSESVYVGDIPSGYGNYAQERLCRETGGKCYPFRSGMMKTSKIEYDEALLEKEYAPDRCSRADSEKRGREIPLLGATRKALEALHKAPWPPLNVEQPHPPTLAVWLKDVREKARARRQVFEAQLELLEKARQRSAVDLSRRVEANAELLCAQIRLERYYMAGLEESVDGILSKPLPDWPPRNRAYLILEKDPPLSNETEARLEEARKAYEALGKRHPKTPWEALAQATLKGLRPGRRILHFYEPHYVEQPKY